MGNSFTVGQLIAALKNIPAEAELSFEGGLTYSALHFERSDGGRVSEVVIQFAEIMCDLSKEFSRNNPTVKVAFAEIDNSGKAVEAITAPRL